MGKAQLFSKLLWQFDVDVAKFKGFRAPKSACAYDRVTGICDKGKFEIVTFRRASGRIIKRATRYVDDAGNETLTIKNWSKQGDVVRSTTSVNGEVQSGTTRLYRDRVDGIYIQEETVYNSALNKPDEHKLGFYSRLGEKPREISWTTNWDGTAPKFHYKNIEGRLPEEGLEYAPMIVSEGSIKRYDHVLMARLRAHGNENIAPNRVERVPCEVLNNGCKTPQEAQEKLGSFCFGQAGTLTGEVKIYNKIKSNRKIIETEAHEAEHVNQSVNMFRMEPAQKPIAEMNQQFKAEVEPLREQLPPQVYNEAIKLLNFMNKSAAKGIIRRKDSPIEYWYYKQMAKHSDPSRYAKLTQTLEGHHTNFTEIGPIRVQKEEVAKFDNLCKNIFDLLGL